MTIIQKIEISAHITNFTLFKEGLFYKCYNEDAMVFVEKVRQYKVNAKFVKSVGKIVYSIGFPVAEVDKGNLTLEYISERIGAFHFDENGRGLVFKIGESEVKKNYNSWIDTLRKDKGIELGNQPESCQGLLYNMDTIVTMIKDFDLANSTPMQGLGFIQDLKLEVQSILSGDGNI
jgi:hypothetical protein